MRFRHQQRAKTLNSLGFIHINSCPHVHEQNGLAERKHMQIVETCLVVLASASMPFKLWDQAIRTTFVITNRLPCSTILFKFPLTVLFKRDPQYSTLKTFGYICYPDMRPCNKHKFDYKSKPCTFIGYSLSHKGYKCLSKCGRIYISRNVIFYESQFPFSKDK